MSIGVFRARGVAAENNALFFSPPVTRYATAVHIPNTSASKAARNFLPGLSAGVSFGTPPVMTADYLRFVGGSSAIETAIAESARLTVYIVCRNGGSTFSGNDVPVFLSNYATTARDNPAYTANGLRMRAPNSATLEVSVGVATGSGALTAISVPVADWSSWNLFCFRCSATTLFLKNHTANVESANVPLTGTRLVGTGLLRIGSDILAGLTGASEIAYVQTHSIEHTSTEIADTVAATRKLMAGIHSISV